MPSSSWPGQGTASCPVRLRHAHRRLAAQGGLRLPGRLFAGGRTGMPWLPVPGAERGERKTCTGLSSVKHSSWLKSWPREQAPEDHELERGTGRTEILFGAESQRRRLSTVGRACIDPAYHHRPGPALSGPLPCATKTARRPAGTCRNSRWAIGAHHRNAAVTGIAWRQRHDGRNAAPGEKSPGWKPCDWRSRNGAAGSARNGRPDLFPATSRNVQCSWRWSVATRQSRLDQQERQDNRAEIASNPP